MSHKENQLLDLFAWTFVVLAIAIFALAIIGLQNRNCWDQYKTETAAIEHCEQHP